LIEGERDIPKKRKNYKKSYKIKVALVVKIVCVN
jgi:hypothetical protein